MAKSRSPFTTGFGIGVSVVVAVALVFAVHAWLLMLVWGGIAVTFGWQTLGYGTAFLFSLLTGLVFGGSAAGSRS